MYMYMLCMYGSYVCMGFVVYDIQCTCMYGFVCTCTCKHNTVYVYVHCLSTMLLSFNIKVVMPAKLYLFSSSYDCNRCDHHLLLPYSAT